MDQALGQSQVTVGELIKLCAIDNDLFCHTFFPNAVRRNSPSYAPDVWKRLENPSSRLVNLRIFRGGFKTTTLRLFTAKRIAYGLSRTILYIGASEAHAVRSVQWLKGRIESLRGASGADQPPLFASVFDLRPGKKWTENEIEVFHGTDLHPIWVLGVGITGNIRGINFDDYRPDLIILDDVVTDENAQTEEQREKLQSLVLGAVRNSLAPAQESPNAKMVLLQTPIHTADVSSKAAKDAAWSTAIYPCWTLATARASDVGSQVSSWEDQFSTASLRKQKQEAINNNTLSIFAREMECRLVQQELRDFRTEWLRYYEPSQLADIRSNYVLGIDPVPPPSPQALAENMEGRDYECHAVWCRNTKGYFLVELRTNRGHDPGWSVATALGLATKYSVSRIVVETIMYQRVLKWHLEREMIRRRTFVLVKAYEDRRRKYNRITSVFGNLAPQGLINVRREHTDFIQQFEEFHGGDHDDILDASSIALSDLVSPTIELGADAYYFNDEDVPKLEALRACP